MTGDTEPLDLDAIRARADKATVEEPDSELSDRFTWGGVQDD